MKITTFFKSLLGLIVLGYCFTQPLSAQEFKPVNDAESVQNKINKEAESIISIKSKFQQEKHLSFMLEPIVSEGLFLFKKENQLRWEYVKPFEYLILFNGTKITIKDQNKTNEFDASSNAIFKQINDLMLGAIKGDLGKSDGFNISLNESIKQYQLLLTPKNDELKAYVSVVEIYFDKEDLAVSILKMVESTGDYTKIIFSDRKFNEVIDEAAFISN